MVAQQKRVRRRPEEARTLILDAAEAVMGSQGPAGLRLQEVARKAGVSHPTILHHFGSREGLVRALNQRSVAVLTETVLARMNTQSGDEGIRQSFAAYREGLAQRIVWLLQADAPPPETERLALFEQIVESLHRVRQALARPGHVPDMADTRHVVHLTTIAAFGDALIGPRLRQASGEAERAAREAFETWFSGLIELYIGRMAGL